VTNGVSDRAGTAGGLNSRRLALVFAAVAVLCGGVVWFGAARLAPALFGLDCEPESTPSVSPVYTDTTSVARLFPKLGAFTGVHWQTRAVRPRTCPDVGPMDHVTEGVVTLSPEPAARYRAGFRWDTAAPDIAAALQPFVPKSPQWTRSAEFDNATGPGGFFLDAASGTLYFVHHTS
jgi:hypothetical protein